MTLRDPEHAARVLEHIGRQPAECVGCGEQFERRQLTRDDDGDLLCSECLHGTEHEQEGDDCCGGSGCRACCGGPRWV